MSATAPLARPAGVWPALGRRAGLGLRLAWAGLLGQACLLCERTGAALCEDCRIDCAVREARRWRCARCAEPVGSPLLRSGCVRCRTTPPAFDRAICGFDYAAPVDALARGLKFSRRLAAARALARLLVDAVGRSDEPLPDAIVALPLSPARLAARGFNQAHAIAAPVARELGRPLLVQPLRRIRLSPALSHLGADDRRAAIAGAFAAGRSRGIARCSIGLVDDVMTTGATLESASAVLKAMGATRVVAMPALRTPPPPNR